MTWNTYELSEFHLSRATAIFVVDCCQFGPNWMFGLKMELMACAEMVGSTTEQRCLFTDIIWYYQWYETIKNCLNYTSAMTQPFLMLIAANLAQVWFLGWKRSIWPVQDWSVVPQSKAAFFMILYDSINDMKQFWIVCITAQPCHSNFCCWLLPIWP